MRPIKWNYKHFMKILAPIISSTLYRDCAENLGSDKYLHLLLKDPGF